MNLLAKSSAKRKELIVIGTGPVGIQFIKSARSCLCDCNITVFGNESWEPYNRVKLSSFFAGQLKWDELIISQKLPQSENLTAHHNCAIVKIDPDRKLVLDELGRSHNYDKLIIATGSTPHIPNILGIKLKNIFTFRNLSDIDKLQARRTRSRRTVVIGGGVLGLEVAKAMSRENTEVIIVEHATYLMSSQLDANSAELLREYILSLGIKVYLGQAIKEFCGENTVEKILLNDGREIQCDTVILTTGIKPNIELARKAHLSVGRGIRVDDSMQTSDRDIYAIGECAEHRGKIYGVVKPGYEQAKVAAFSLSGKKSNYTGSLSATQIKVIDVPVLSMGDIDKTTVISNKQEYVYISPGEKIYRKIIVKNHKIAGVIAIGKWNQQERVREGILNKRFIWFWNLKQFVKTGSIWF
jgi:nitrite reductase (NADH) large subunit